MTPTFFLLFLMTPSSGKIVLWAVMTHLASFSLRTITVLPLRLCTSKISGSTHPWIIWKIPWVSSTLGTSVWSSLLVLWAIFSFQSSRVGRVRVEVGLRFVFFCLLCVQILSRVSCFVFERLDDFVENHGDERTQEWANPVYVVITVEHTKGSIRSKRTSRVQRASSVENAFVC